MEQNTTEQRLQNGHGLDFRYSSAVTARVKVNLKKQNHNQLLFLLAVSNRYVFPFLVEYFGVIRIQFLFTFGMRKHRLAATRLLPLRHCPAWHMAYETFLELSCANFAQRVPVRGLHCLVSPTAGAGIEGSSSFSISDYKSDTVITISTCHHPPLACFQLLMARFIHCQQSTAETKVTSSSSSRIIENRHGKEARNDAIFLKATAISRVGLWRQFH